MSEISRRKFLELAGITTLGALLAGCGNPPEATQTTIKVVPEIIKKIKTGNEVREWSGVIDLSTTLPDDPIINNLNSHHVSAITKNAPQITTKAYFHTEPMQMIWSDAGSQRDKEQKVIITYFDQKTKKPYTDFALWTTKNDPDNSSLVTDNLTLAQTTSNNILTEFPSYPFISIVYDKTDTTIPTKIIFRDAPDNPTQREFTINKQSGLKLPIGTKFGADLIKQLIDLIQP